MEISTFELLVKRIAPPPAPIDVARRVVQGYFLTITNLEAKDLTFRLRFRISKPNPVDPDRTLFNNVDFLIDIAGANNPISLAGGAGSTLFSGSFVLPAKQTASVQLLPKATLFADPLPDFEVRGYVELRLPALGPIFNRKPQSETPVKVLINPEVRGTFLPNDFPGGTGGDFDQINYPLAIATGKALNEIDPDPGIPIIIKPELLEALQQRSIDLPLMDVDDLEIPQNLVEMLAQLDRDPRNLENLSDVLSKLEIPLRVSGL